MMQGIQSKDFSILAPVMDHIDEKDTVTKLKEIGNINSQQGKFLSDYYSNYFFLITVYLNDN